MAAGMREIVADEAKPASLPASTMYQEILESLDADIPVIGQPDQALNVFDFEKAARLQLSPAHFGYLATGTDDDSTVMANRNGFRQFKLRARRLTGVTDTNTSTRIFGRHWGTPLALAPIGNERAFHNDGAIAIARAARTQNSLQILSYGSNFSLEEVNAARGEPVWFQLYPNSHWGVTEAVIKRVEAAGCEVMVLTVDMVAGHNRETTHRFRQIDKADCTSCHTGDRNTSEKYPTLAGLKVNPDATSPAQMDWSLLDRIKDSSSMKLVIKGIVTSEDARLCLDHGADGIIVSNHGGRAENSGRSSIECLPEIVSEVNRVVPVMIDSGFRRGTDVFKALALGANAVCIGRPYVWGLASYGQQGLEAVLQLLNRELQLVMRQCGTPNLEAINESTLA